jgi:hypothetical protein
MDDVSIHIDELVLTAGGGPAAVAVTLRHQEVALPADVLEEVARSVASALDAGTRQAALPAPDRCAPAQAAEKGREHRAL